jgi:hypothetical protein
MPLTADDQPVPSYECHEGNSAIAMRGTAFEPSSTLSARTRRPRPWCMLCLLHLLRSFATPTIWRSEERTEELQ